MHKNMKEMKNNGKEIKIPFEYVEKIDRLIKSGTANYHSRDEFITSAVQIKLAELNGSGTK